MVEPTKLEIGEHDALLIFPMAKILLVDDDQDSLALYASFLRDHSHRVRAVSDGVHALAALDAGHFDVLVTDMVMPFIDGPRLARLVRHRFAGDPPLVIALSAATLEETRTEPHPFIDAYVAKGPFDRTAPILLSVIEEKRGRKEILKDRQVRSRRITEELLESRRELEVMLNELTQGVVLLNEEGLVLYANAPALQLLETAEEELLARPLTAAIPGARDAVSPESLRKIGTSGTAHRTILDLHGGEVIARLKVTPSPEDPEHRFFTLLTDVTAEHTFSNALKKSERGYRAIVESTTDLLWTLDTTGTLTYVNPSQAHFTGYSAGEYYAKGPALLLGTAERGELDTLLRDALRRCAGGESVSMERQLPTKSGGYLWSLIRISPLRDDGGDFIGLRCIATNVHRRRLAEEQLRRAVGEREALIGEIHHRVKNSVQLIISMLRLRLSRFSDLEVQEASREMESRFRVIATVYAHLYEYRKLDRLEGATLVTNVVQLAKNDLPPFRVELQGEPFVLSLDHAIPLGLIIREIVSNVGKHVAPVTREPSLKVEWLAEDGSLVLRFADNGPGFPRSVLEQPRELGLLMASSLVEQLRGSIRMEESPEGAALVVMASYTPPEPLEETETI